MYTIYIDPLTLLIGIVVGVFFCAALVTIVFEEQKQKQQPPTMRYYVPDEYSGYSGYSPYSGREHDYPPLAPYDPHRPPYDFTREPPYGAPKQ